MVIKVHKLRLKIFDLEKKLGEMLHPWIHENSKNIKKCSNDPVSKNVG
jgi:hypothetical protein